MFSFPIKNADYSHVFLLCTPPFPTGTVLTSGISKITMHVWDVRTHLAGHVTREALMCLEEALDPFVKERVKEHFPETNPDKVRLSQLKEELVALEKDMQREKGPGKKKLGTRKRKMLAEQRKLLKAGVKADAKNVDEERHSVECR